MINIMIDIMLQIMQYAFIGRLLWGPIVSSIQTTLEEARPNI